MYKTIQTCNGHEIIINKRNSYMKSPYRYSR